jgi:hypothetical protein
MANLLFRPCALFLYGLNLSLSFIIFDIVCMRLFYINALANVKDKSNVEWPIFI